MDDIGESKGSSAPCSRGWAYGAIYRDSNERNAALAGWLDFYNRRRPHGALSHKPPLARLNELNNLLGSYT
jgi:transposase InsO family protein